MIEKRLYKPSELTAIGVSRETLRVWREDPEFPKPVRGKFYDIKAIEAYLDKLSGLKSSEPNYEQMFGEDLNGSNQGELPNNTHP